MTNQVSIEWLRYTHAVAKARSFSAAARAYGVTQPALSNGIAKFENHLGARLFDRSPRGVTVTAFGSRILPMVDRSLNELDAVLAESRRWTRSDGASIAVGISPLISARLVALAFTAARELPIPRNLVLSEAHMHSLHEGLKAGDLDMILIPSVTPLSGFEHRIIEAEPVVIVDNSPTPGDTVALPETADREFILLPDTCGLTRFTMQLFDVHHLPLHSYVGEAATYRVLEEWASLGLGAALIPKSKLTSPHAPHQTLVDDDGNEIEVFYKSVWHRDSAFAADLQVMAATLAAR